VAATDKRELLLVIRGRDQGAKKALDGVGDAADDAKDDLDDMNKGLKTLDKQTSDTTRRLAQLRQEFAKSGDTGLIRDIQKAESELKKLSRQRRLTLGVEVDRDLTRIDARLTELARRREALVEAKADEKDIAKVKAQIADLTKRRKAIINVTFDRDAAVKATKGLDKLLTDAGNEGGKGFASALVARIGPLVITKAPALAGSGGAIAAGLAAGALPVLGASIAGAIIGGVGAGGVVGGVALAAKHPAVQAEAKSLAEAVGAQLERVSEPMVPATIDSIKIIRRQIGEMEDDLTDTFAAAAEHAPVLAEGVGDAIKSVVRGIRTLIQRADPVIDVLADSFRDLGDAIEDGFGDLSDNANEAARGLQLTLKVVNGLVVATFKLIDGLSEAYGLMDSVAGLMRGDPGPLIRNLFEDAYEAERSSRALEESQRGLIGGFHLTQEAAEQAAAATRAYADANRALTDQNLAVAESTVRYKEAINAARDAVDKKRKVSLDEEKALLSQARASNTLIDSLDRQGASAAVLAAKHDQARKELIRTAERMGYTKAQAVALADQYLAVPRRVDTLFTADTDQAARNLRAVRDLIAQIKSKKVVITTVNNVRTVRSEGRAVGIGDGIGGREKGGPVRAGEAYLVGERRPEVFVPDRDGTIIPSIEKFTRSVAGSVSRPGGGQMQVSLVLPPVGGPPMSQMMTRFFNEALATGQIQMSVRIGQTRYPVRVG
jgi:hypothetical protein